MKVLEVYGSDYSALDFEKDDELSVAQVVKLCEENGGQYTVDKHYYADFKLHDFGEVDPKFIQFVYSDVQGYEQSKHSNFYVVDEE